MVLSIAGYLFPAFIDTALLALHPLFLSTPIHLGGLGMSPPQIGLCLGIFGILDGIVQGVFFAKLIRRIGLKRLFLLSLFSFIPLFSMFPVINHFAREWGRSPAVWALVIFQLMINCVTEMSFGTCASSNSRQHDSHRSCRIYSGCAFMYITSSVKNPRTLGSVHGIGQTGAALVRTISPAMTTSLFAYTLQNDWLGGLGVYIVLIAISSSGLRLAYKLPEKGWEH